jgi:SagB-type dehydrogenase family enzyme
VNVDVYVSDRSTVVTATNGTTRLIKNPPADLLEGLVGQSTSYPSDGSSAATIPPAATLTSIREAAGLSIANSPADPEASTWELKGPRVQCRDDGAPSTPLTQLLSSRRSGTATGPVRVGAVGTVLVRSYRVQTFALADDGYQRSWRPVPSAGGRHPFELLLAADRVQGLESGWWWFDATRCSLVAVSLNTPAEEYLKHTEKVVGTRPAAAVVCVAEAGRTLSRYNNGTSLIWRDAGALQATIHLCANDVGIASRIVAASGLIREPTWPPLRFDAGAVLLGANET